MWDANCLSSEKVTSRMAPRLLRNRNGARAHSHCNTMPPGAPDYRLERGMGAGAISQVRVRFLKSVGFKTVFRHDINFAHLRNHGLEESSEPSQNPFCTPGRVSPVGRGSRTGAQVFFLSHSALNTRGGPRLATRARHSSGSRPVSCRAFSNVS